MLIPATLHHGAAHVLLRLSPEGARLVEQVYCLSGREPEEVLIAAAEARLQRTPEDLEQEQ